MVAFAAKQIGQTYCCHAALNLYKTPAAESLVTQVAPGRQLQILTQEADALWVRLCDDDYPGWLRLSDGEHLTPTPHPYQAPSVTQAMIQDRLPAVIQFAQAAMTCPNEYCWGGTLAPNYDCSGLVQAAFRSVGIIVPRDSYQQEAFVEPIAIADLQPGDLIFFGNRDRATHVALHLQNGQYIHSSGKDQGRNGIGIDSLTDHRDPVSRRYAEQFRMAGRVVTSYQPTGIAPTGKT